MHRHFSCEEAIQFIERRLCVLLLGRKQGKSPYDFCSVGANWKDIHVYNKN